MWGREGREWQRQGIRDDRKWISEKGWIYKCERGEFWQRWITRKRPSCPKAPEIVRKKCGLGIMMVETYKVIGVEAFST
jgi:hypothetical protein